MDRSYFCRISSNMSSTRCSPPTSTHDFSTLRHYADKVILLQQTILKTGTPGEVLSSPEFRSVFHLDLGEKGGSAQ